MRQGLGMADVACHVAAGALFETDALVHSGGRLQIDLQLFPDKGERLKDAGMFLSVV